MTERLADIGAHIHAVEQVGAVVNAMRGIAGARVQRSRALLPAVRAYAEVCGEAIVQALALDGEPAAPHRASGAAPILLVFGAEQGFVGAFAGAVLDAAASAPDSALASTSISTGAQMMVVGARTAVLARERGLAPAWEIAMPTHPQSLAALAADVTDALYDRMEKTASGAAAMVVPVWTPGAGLTVEHSPLTPLDPKRLPSRRTIRMPPLTTLPTPLLLERLTEEYVFARICEAAVQAFVAENQARMEAMAAAKRNIDGELEHLEKQRRQIRQDGITEEVLELSRGNSLA